MAIKVGGEGPLVKAIKVGSPNTVVKKVTIGSPILTPATTSVTLHNIEGVTTAGRQHADVLIYDSSREAPNQKYRSGSLSGGIGIARATNFDSDNPQITFYIDSAELQAHHQRYGHWVDDSSKITFGLDSDLKIYHDGTHSFIDAMGPDGQTPQLIIATNQLKVQKGVNSERIITATADSGVKLYFDNTERLASTRLGATITGSFVTDSISTSQLTADSGVITFLSSKHIHTDSATVGQITADSGHFGTLTATNLQFNQALLDSASITSFDAETGSINNLQVDSAQITNLGIVNLQGDSARINHLQADSSILTYISTKVISGDSATFNDLHADSASILTLNAETGSINNLQVDSGDATNFSISQLQVDSAHISTLSANTINFNQVILDSATFDRLDAEAGSINNLQADSAIITYISTKIISGDSARFNNVIADDVNATAGTFSSLDVSGTSNLLGNVKLGGDIGTYELDLSGIRLSSNIIPTPVGVHSVGTWAQPMHSVVNWYDLGFRGGASHIDILAGADSALTVSAKTNMGVRGADYQTYNTNAEEIIFHKKVNFNAGVNIIGSPGSGGVDSGQYGSASEVPVITVNASGLVDSIGTVNVAGVTSVSFDSASYNYTINTADGGVFTQMIHTRKPGLAAGTHGSATLIPTITVNQYGLVDSVGTVSVAGVSSTSFDSADGTLTINTADGGVFRQIIADSDFTNKRARLALSASNSLSYDNATGHFRLPQPLDSAANPTFNQVRGPATFIIDPAAVGDNTGTVKILGNLQVEGTQTTINSTAITLNDKNIVIADSSADSSALNGGGIIWGGDSVVNNPSFTYAHATARLVSNRDIQAANFIGNISGTTIAGDSAIIEHISGRGLNYDSARFNDLKADSGIVTTLSGTNLNYDDARFNDLHADSARFGIISGNTIINASADSNTTHTLGKFRVGSPNNDIMYISHVDQNTASNYALYQSSGGLTNISSVGTLYFNNSNVTNMVLSTTGVGIGEINPNHKLEVVGSTKLRGTLEVTDSAVIKNLSGVGLNFDSSRFQELVADSGVITTISGTNLNYDSATINTLLLPIMGDSNDPALTIGNNQLKIYHDPGPTSLASYIDNYSKTLYIRNNTDRASSSNIIIQPTPGEHGIIIRDHAGVAIYWDNSLKAETIKTGFHVLGTLNTDSATMTNITADSGVITDLSGISINYDSARFNDFHADSAIITNLSGANLNYTSLNFNTLEADSGNFGTLSTDHFNADSGRLGVILSGTQVGIGPAVLIKTDTFQTKFHQANGGHSYIEHAADQPSLVFKCTDAAANNMHNSNIIWRNSINGQKGFIGYSNKNDLYIKSQQGGLNIGGNNGGFAPTIAIKAGTNFVGIGNLDSTSDPTHNLHVKGTFLVEDSGRIPLLSGSGLNYDSARFNDLHADSAHFNTLTANNITFSGFSMDSIHAGHFNADSANINTLQVSKIIPNNQFMLGLLDSDLGLYTRVNVTVNNFGGQNYFSIGDQGGFYGNGATISLADGLIYRFDQSGSNNATHPLRFSTTSDGTHNGGSQYNSDVKHVGTPGTDGAYTQIKIIPNGHPQTLYYYCAAHPGMGGRVIIGTPHSTSNLTEGTNLYYTTNRADSDARSAQIGGNNINYDSATGTIAVSASPKFPNITGNINVAGHIMSSVDSAADLILRRTTANLTGNKELGAIKFAGTDASNNDEIYGQIIGRTKTTTDGSEESQLVFKIRDNGGEHDGLAIMYNGTKLYHVGSQKLATSATGVGVTGAVTATTEVITPKVTLPNSMDIDSSATFAAIDSGHVIDQFPHATYRSAKYLLQASKGTSKYQVSELLLLTTGSSTYITQYGTVTHGYGNDSDLVTFDADISGANTRLTVTTTETDTIVKMRRQAIES